MPSASRTIAVSAAPGAWWEPQLNWPSPQPDAVLDYSLDLSAVMADSSDTITSASVSVSPSGMGELAISSISVQGSLVTAIMGGAPAGRFYSVKVEVTTALGLTMEWPVLLATDWWLAPYPVVAPQSAGFSSPVVWSYQPSLDFSNPANSQMAPST